MKTLTGRTVLGYALILAAVMPSLAAGRAEAAAEAAADWTLPRTEWGAPDLQGVWTNTLSRLSRDRLHSVTRSF